MARDERQGPVRIGGWLMVVVVTVALDALAEPLISWGLFHLAARTPSTSLSTFYRTAAVGEILRGVGYGFLAWRLTMRRQASTVSIVMIGLWLLALALPANTLIAAWLGSGTASVKSVKAVLDHPSVFGTVGYTVIATAYLLRSKRVANTYALTEDDLAAVFR